MSTATEFSIGSEFAGHRIDAVAGRGGMGVVYKATDLRLKRTVALKAIVPALSADPGFRRRFEQESEIAAGIRHPNVITIYAAGEFDDQLYITMEFIEGTDLLRLVRERGALDAKWVADVVGQTAQALQAAHSRGLVHRDVKPANILIAQENGGTQAYLTDFGLTKRTSSESALTQVGTFVGTLDYIAPEQLQGKRVDARADIYALGCVLYQAVSGQVPYPRDSDPAKIFAHMSTPPPSLRETAPWAPPGLDAVISRALQKDPGARYVSAQHLGNAAVAAVAAGHVAQQTTQPRSQPTPRTVAAPAPPPQPATSQAAAPPPPARPAAPPPRHDYGAPQQPAFGGPPHAGHPPGPPGPGAGPPHAERRSRGWLLPVAIVVPIAIAAAVVAVVLATKGNGGGGAARTTVSKPVALSSKAQFSTAGGGAFWMANGQDGTLTRVGADDLAAKTVRVPGPSPSPTNSDYFEGSVWTDSFTDEVARVDATTERTTRIGIAPADKDGWVLLGGSGAMWAIGGSNGKLVRIDPGTNKSGAPIDVGKDVVNEDQCGNFICLVHADGAIGYYDIAGKRLEKFRTPLRRSTGSVWYDNGTLFVGVGNNQIARVDVASGRAGAPLNTGSDVFVPLEGKLWAIYPVEDVLKQFDGRTGQQIGKPIALPGHPHDVDAADGRVWVTLSGTPPRVVEITPP